MAFSYASAYNKFRKELERKHLLYAELDMTNAQIRALDDYDTEEFLSECVYRFHNQTLEIPTDSDFDDGQNPLYKKYGDAMTVEMKVSYPGRYGWMEEISSPKLYERLMMLSEEDLSLLDEYVFGEKSQKTLSEEKGIAQQNISKKLNRIKKFLKK